MRIEFLVVHNFGPYRGEQRVDLAPPQSERPVILFGGLNGAGKTTILEAIQLALFGNLSEPARRSGLAYDEYLRRAANRSAPSSEGAAVTLSLTVQAAGQPTTYRIRRTWDTSGGKGKKNRENLDVWVNEQHDPAMTTAWPEQVAQFMRPRLAPLCFFDGERIEQLADPEQSAAALRNAVGTLLGADLVEQAIADMEVLQRRRRVEQASATDERLPKAEDALEEAESQRKDAMQLVASARTALQRSEELLRRATERYVEQGGRAAEERQNNEKKHTEILAAIRGVEREMVSMAAGELPLALVMSLLRQASCTAEEEAKSLERSIGAVFLEAAAGRLEAELKRIRASMRTMDVLREWLLQELPDRTDAHPTPPITSSAAHNRLQSILEHSLPEQLASIRSLLDRHNELKAQLDEVDRALAMTPDAEAVQSVVAARDEALLDVGQKRQQMEQAERVMADADRLVDVRRRDLDRLLDATRTAKGEASDAERFGRHAAGVKDVLKRFNERLRRRHLERLQKLVLQCYSALLRKADLARELRIDPETYAMYLYDAEGGYVQAERLSAGERQLLAVSLLWAMGLASGRSLPVVVDTPLGRLDSSHRLLLVKRYFPQASGQVVLLSTDEEVDASLYDALEPYVGLSYCLEHDEKRGTRVLAGYPFAGPSQSHGISAGSVAAKE